MEVECIGITQIIHMEETGITLETIGLLSKNYIKRTKRSPKKSAIILVCMVGQKSLELLVCTTGERMTS